MARVKAKQIQSVKAEQIEETSAKRFVTDEHIESINKPTSHIHTQIMPSNTWEIKHPLDKIPSVTVTDSGGNVVNGDITYIDNSNVLIEFTSVFAGEAHLN